MTAVQKSLRIPQDTVKENESWSRNIVTKSYPHLIRGRE
jgi:hypothetical protein